jgi:small-conductance mechanosensitive channel
MDELLKMPFLGFFTPEIWRSVYVLVIAWILKQVSKRIIFRNVEDVHHRFNITRRTSRIITFVALSIVVMVWLDGKNVPEIIKALSFLGAGLAIVLREVILNIVGWLQIVTRAPFQVGDRVEINNISGDVIDIRLMTTTLMEIRSWVDADQSTGRIMRIPNNWVFQFAVKNFTQGFDYIWNEITLHVTTDSDWNLARDIMTSLAQESSAIVEHQVKSQLKNMAQEYLVYYSTLTPFVYVTIADKGIRLTLRYLCKVRNRRGSEHAIMMRVLEEFAKHPSIHLKTDL